MWHAASVHADVMRSWAGTLTYQLDRRSDYEKLVVASLGSVEMRQGGNRGMRYGNPRIALTRTEVQP
jgi:hypothetical protein